MVCVCVHCSFYVCMAVCAFSRLEFYVKRVTLLIPTLLFKTGSLIPEFTNLAILEWWQASGTFLPLLTHCWGLQARHDFSSFYVVIFLVQQAVYWMNHIFQSLNNFTQQVTFNGELCFIKWRLIKYYPFWSYTNEILVFIEKCNKNIRNNMFYETVSGLNMLYRTVLELCQT